MNSASKVVSQTATSESPVKVPRPIGDRTRRHPAERAGALLKASDKRACLIAAEWRVSDSVYAFPGMSDYRAIAAELDLHLATVVALDAGGYEHLLFLCRIPGLSGRELMDCLTVSRRNQPLRVDQ